MAQNEKKKGIATKIIEKIRERREEHKKEREERKQERQEEIKVQREAQHQERIRQAKERGRRAIQQRESYHEPVRRKAGRFAEGYKRSTEKYLISKPKGSGFGTGQYWDLTGGSKPKKKLPPQRVTKVSKSGTVTITEPVEKKPEQKEPYNNFWDLTYATSPNQKKKERHRRIGDLL